MLRERQSRDRLVAFFSSTSPSLPCFASEAPKIPSGESERQEDLVREGKEGRGKEVAAAAGRGRSRQKILPLLEETGSPVWLFAFVSAGSRIAGSAEEATGAENDHRVKIGCRDLSREWESCQLARLFPNSHSNQPRRRRRKFDSGGIWFSSFLFLFFPSHEGTFPPPSGRRGKKRRVPTTPILYEYPLALGC